MITNQAPDAQSGPSAWITDLRYSLRFSAMKDVYRLTRDEVIELMGETAISIMSDTPPSGASDAAIAAITGKREVCTCPSGDGSLRWPCPHHPPAQVAGSGIVDGDIRSWLSDYADILTDEGRANEAYKVKQALAAQPAPVVGGEENGYWIVEKNPGHTRIYNAQTGDSCEIESGDESPHAEILRQLADDAKEWGRPRSFIVGSKRIDGLHVIIAKPTSDLLPEQLLVRYDDYIAAMPIVVNDAMVERGCVAMSAAAEFEDSWPDGFTEEQQSDLRMSVRAVLLSARPAVEGGDGLPELPADYFAGHLCDYYTADQMHAYALAAVAKAQGQKCGTCNGHGVIGGPSYREPDEGGEPCPDCNPAAVEGAQGASVRNVMQAHQESAERANFKRCGCDYCDALRATPAPERRE